MTHSLWLKWSCGARSIWLWIDLLVLSCLLTRPVVLLTLLSVFLTLLSVSLTLLTVPSSCLDSLSGFLDSLLAALVDLDVCKILSVFDFSCFILLDFSNWLTKKMCSKIKHILETFFLGKRFLFKNFILWSKILKLNIWEYNQTAIALSKPPKLLP